jgi:hypothetical protein
MADRRGRSAPDGDGDERAMGTLFRARDGVLAVFYLTFITLNGYFVRDGDAKDFATALLMLGMVAVFVAWILQRERPDRLKFGSFTFRLFVLLMAAAIVADFLTISWPGRPPWLPKRYF